MPVGQIEWYTKAIIGYEALHGKKIDKNKVSSIDLNISSDSKNLIRSSTKNKILQTKFSNYLFNSINYSNNLIDIQAVKGNRIPKNIDIFTYSFPCQDLSIQGKQKGMEKDSNTRSSLLWQVGRILKEMNTFFEIKEMPKYLLMENVRSILFKKNKTSFNEWIEKLNSLGYKSKVFVLDSSDYGSPQKRVRAFCLSIRKDICSNDFDLFAPIKTNQKKKNIQSILEKNVKNTFLDKLNSFERTNMKLSPSGIKKCSLLKYTNFNSEAYLYDKEFLGPTLTATGANSRIKILDNNNIRSLSACECMKYMGFKKSAYEKLINSNLLTESNIIFLAGNSISIEVLKSIFERLNF